MSLFRGLIITLCILVQANCSLFDFIRIVDEDGNTQIRITNPSAAFVQEFWLSSTKLTNKKSFKDCSSSKELRRIYTDGTHLKISHWKDECILLNYTARSNKIKSLKASFDIRKGHMYGGPMNEKHGDLNWPAEESFFVDEPYMNIESGSKNGLFYQAVLEPYWLFSNGYYIYVDNDVPVFITSNSSHRFELRAGNVSEKSNQPSLALNFALCKLENPRQAHEHAIKLFLEKPSTLPDIRGVTQPVWTTLVPFEFHESINQAAVVDFAQKIIKHGYGGRLVIGHEWEMHFGSLEPNRTKFSNFKRLINHLKSLNFALDVRVHPFVSYKVKLSQKDRRYLAKEEILDIFFHGYGRYINVTNPNALNWFHKRLLQFRKTYGVDSFDFYHGNYEGLMWNNKIPNQVEIIIHQISRLLAAFNSNIVTNMARGTQKYGFFVAIPSATNAQSHWRALRAVIPRLLQMNILGYSFTLPNIMGGNHKDISREQYIRWVQLTVFMPSMQFSIYRPPWSYDKEIVELTKKFVDLHANYSSYIIELMEENVKIGAPVNPPIWWISPNDSTALACKAIIYDSTTVDLPGQSICRSEFLLGEEILVAPVVVEGQTKRDIYLPIGFWKDGNSDRTFNGPTWVKDYPADLNILPYFIRLQAEPFTDNENRKKRWISRFEITQILVILGIFLISIVLIAFISPQLSKSVYTNIKYKMFK